MTQTTQPRSWVLLDNPGKDLNATKPGKQDNMGLLLEVFDSLNSLYEKLNRLNYAIQRKNMEQILYLKNTGARK